MDPDPVEAGPDSAEAGLCQVRTGEGSSRPGARAGQEEGWRRPGQALERQGGGHRGRYRYIRNMMYRIRLDWVRGRGLEAARGNHIARKAGRKFGSASRLELNF